MPDLLPGQVTLAVLRELVAAKCDQPTPTDSTNVTIGNYNAFISRAYREAVGILVDLFQDQYVNPDNGNPYTFLTDGKAWLYPLPNDFFKLLGCDALWTPGQIQTAVTMRPFMQQERNRFQGFGVGPGIAPWVPLYRLNGNQLWLQPMPPQANLQILVRYVPLQPDLQDIGTITIDAIEAGDSIVISWAPSIPVSAPVNGVLPVLPASSTMRYVAYNAGSPPPPDSRTVFFAIGATVEDTAANLADVLNAAPPWTTGTSQDQTTSRATVADNVVSFQLFNAYAVVWSTSSGGGHPEQLAGGIALAPLPMPTQSNPYGAWTNWCNLLNGFDELVLVDACIQVKQKQQQFEDVQSFEQRKAEMRARLVTEANNRNAAQPARITNVRRGRGPYGTYGFGGR